jgi:enterochelin esterase-like enzyme
MTKLLTRREWFAGAASIAAFAQQPKSPDGFQWVNKPAKPLPGVTHATFFSPTHKTGIGYCIYLPPSYETERSRRFPVVYYLHGGRPGSELKSVALVRFIDAAIRKAEAPPAIYVFSNGGAVSHYDYPAFQSYGETALVKELIPHVDKTYRTIAKRDGRALEGFSQGGRGTARIMFKYPELFCSAAPMGGGHQHEKHISLHNGKEDGDPGYQFSTKHNTYDLARAYAANRKPLDILVVVGTKDFNYEANLEWMQHLDALHIPYRRIIVPDTPHNAQQVYEKVGGEVMRFHAANFKKAGAA